MKPEKKTPWPMHIVIVVGALATAFAIIPQLDGARTWLLERWNRYDSVQLSGSYPDELWKQAKPKQFAWLEDEWCFPSLPGFRSRFRIQNGILTRQNEGRRPQAFISEWVVTEVYISDRGVLRLRYMSNDWPGNYVEFQTNKTAEWRESERYADNRGAISSGKGRLVLSCGRCKVSSDGITYSCSGDV